MTSEYEPDRNESDCSSKECEELIGHVRYVRRKVDDIITRLQDSYEILQEILDSINAETGAGWYDHYGHEDEY